MYCQISGYFYVCDLPFYYKEKIIIGCLYGVVVERRRAVSLSVLAPQYTHTHTHLQIPDFYAITMVMAVGGRLGLGHTQGDNKERGR